MAIVVTPRLKPIPEGATKDDRERMHKNYIAELARLNPGHFHANGTRKSVFWRLNGFLNMIFNVR